VVDISEFRPAWWLRNPHLQTAWSRLTRRRPRIALRQERLELPDGDFIDLSWTPGTHGPIVIVLHGLQGSSRSPYARGILRAVHRRGWRGLLMHFRGCSGEPNRLPRSYHSGDTGDVAYLAERLQDRWPGVPLLAVGYSLGGNVLLKWLGETGSASPLTAAAAISVPFLLGDAADRLEAGLSRVYQWMFLRDLRAAVLRKRRHMHVPGIPAELRGLHTFRAFDDQVTAPLHGFRDVEDYYARASCRQYLSGIRVPTLIVHALDDPFMRPGTAPRVGELPPAVTLELSPHGGHVGFIGGPTLPRYWLEQRVPAFLAGVLQAVETEKGP
jgi:predicted alpha/beta-fold hydrolase